MVIKNIILKSKMVIFNTLNFFIFGISMNICILMLNKFIHLFIVCVCVHAHHWAYVEVRGQPHGISCSLPLGDQAWYQAPLPTELSPTPNIYSFAFFCFFKYQTSNLLEQCTTCPDSFLLRAPCFQPQFDPGCHRNNWIMSLNPFDTDIQILLVSV